MKVGDPAPDFELDGTEGRFRLSDHRGERVVLLFYPGDFTPVCTKQFCSYAERADDMSSLGATVVGISAQDVDSHTKFVSENGIPVPLLADPDKKVAKSFGASVPVVGTRRAVVIVDEDGKIAYKHVHTLGLDFQTVDDIKEALAKV
jgi:peroxiredoxin Q/BCP